MRIAEDPLRGEVFRKTLDLATEVLERGEVTGSSKVYEIVAPTSSAYKNPIEIVEGNLRQVRDMNLFLKSQLNYSQ